MVKDFMRKNAKDRWFFRLCVVGFMAVSLMIWIIFNPTPSGLNAQRTLKGIFMGVGGFIALYALYYLVLKRSYMTLPEYRAMKRQGDPERMIERIENDVRERQDILQYNDKSRLFVITRDYVFATHWHDGGLRGWRTLSAARILMNAKTWLNCMYGSGRRGTR